jgi:hypothetical protein
MNWQLEPSAALSACAILISFSVLISSLELMYLAGKGEFSTGGAWDWAVLKSVSMPRSKWFDIFCRRDNSFLFLLFMRSTAALGLGVLGLHSAASPYILSALVLCQFILNNRLIWGDDGSDQMASLILVTLLVSTIASTSQILCVVFIAAQLTLSYVASGIAKLFGPQWREGTAFQNIMGHHTYGNRYIYNLMIKFSPLSKLANYGVITFQVSFPLFFIIPFPYALSYLAVGLAFHLGISAVMRLNGFLIAFCSGYPALLAAHFLLHNLRGF